MRLMWMNNRMAILWHRSCSRKLDSEKVVTKVFKKYKRLLCLISKFFELLFHRRTSLTQDYCFTNDYRIARKTCGFLLSDLYWHQLMQLILYVIWFLISLNLQRAHFPIQSLNQIIESSESKNQAVDRSCVCLSVLLKHQFLFLFNSDNTLFARFLTKILWLTGVRLISLAKLCRVT